MITNIIQSFIDEFYKIKKDDFTNFVFYISQILLIIFYCIEKYLSNKENNTFEQNYYKKK